MRKGWSYTPPDFWQAWWLRRHPRCATWTLTQRHLYILPTGAGALYAVLLAALLLGSINYQLNLGYLLTFVLTGTGVVALHATHATLQGLQLSLATPPDAAASFVGQALPVMVEVTEADPPRHAVGRFTRWLSVGQGLGRFGIGLRWKNMAGEPVWLDVPPGASRRAELIHLPLQRGPQDVPALQIETRFPLGLFRAWSVWRPDLPLLAWPAPEWDAPELAPPMPADADSPEAITSPQPATTHDMPEPDGVRAWRQGDAPRQVLWRLSARSLDSGGPLLVRDWSLPPDATGHLSLDWHDTADLPDTEARLSRLCAWVLQADHRELSYALQLPGVHLPPAAGAAQRRAALDALARWAL